VVLPNCIECKINGLKNVSKGGVVIVCKDKASTKKCSEAFISKLGEDYEVSLPESNGPLLKDRCSKIDARRARR
jgi:hypothetical protein